MCLYRALAGEDGLARSIKEFCDRLEGDEHITDVVLVDQSPIGRTPRSNPATYIKAFDAIRELFADTPEAKRRGYTAGHFSFNIPGGRCETCQGDGTVTVEMQFLADVELICEECRGHALQEQRAGRALSRQEHPRSAATDGARGAGVLSRTCRR